MDQQQQQQQNQQQNPPLSPSGRSVVVEQVTLASEIVPNGAISSNEMGNEMAPPSYTQSAQKNEQPTDMVVDPPLNNNIMSNNNSNGKVCVDIEMAVEPKNELSTESKSATPNTPAQKAAAFSDSVERIVNAAESREASARESSLANGTNGEGVFEAAA